MPPASPSQKENAFQAQSSTKRAKQAPEPARPSRTSSPPRDDVRHHNNDRPSVRF